MSTILSHLEGGVLTLTLNRPEAMNAMDAEVYAELSKAWIDVRDNPDVWVARWSNVISLPWRVGSVNDWGKYLATGSSSFIDAVRLKNIERTCMAAIRANSNVSFIRESLLLQHCATGQRFCS